MVTLKSYCDCEPDPPLIRDPDCLHNVAICQCEIGREKLLTAPVFRTTPSEAVEKRQQTAPCAREQEKPRYPTSHVVVTFRSPQQSKDETFKKAYPASTPLKYAKQNLARLLSVANCNLLLVKNRMVLRESNLLSDIPTDPNGHLEMDVFTLDGEEFSLGSIPKETYVEDLLSSELPKKKTMPYIAIKFRLRNQNETFTRSYNSIMKVQEVKKNLAGLFQMDHDNFVLLRGDKPLKDRMTLIDLDYDAYGIVEVEILTKNRAKLNLNKLYQEIPVCNDVMTVTVPFGATMKEINVEIFADPMKKPYLGGYKNVKTGQEFHHAYTQTPQKPEKLGPELKSCRDTQTAEEREKVFDTCYSRATQMTNEKVFIPNVTDRIVCPRPYETYEEMVRRLNHDHHATVIQRAYRHYKFRQMIERWLAECMERIARMKEEDRLEQEAMERRLRRDLITRTFPQTRQDFDQLYAMVDRWKHAEITRISGLHSKGPKIAAFTLLLDKEVELLRAIEAYRVKVKDNDKKIKKKKFLEELSKPVVWFGKDGKLVSMETIEIQKARTMKELYNAFTRDDMEVKDRLELLVDVKFALQEFNHPLTDEITSLLDQEADLLIRRCNARQLEFLRRRTAAAIFRFMETSELNSGITKLKDIRQYRRMQNSRLHYCEFCKQVKPQDDFPLNTRMHGFKICMSCSWKDVSEKLWIDMTPYRFILRAVQREERRRKCWGSLAFVVREQDIFFIVQKLWHSHSAISEADDLTELRLCRWHVQEDWAPWNCFLVTVQEMKAHLKLEDPEKVYDEELVMKVKNKHKLAKANFGNLMGTDLTFSQSGQWHAVRAPARRHLNGVDPI